MRSRQAQRGPTNPLQSPTFKRQRIGPTILRGDGRRPRRFIFTNKTGLPEIPLPPLQVVTHLSFPAMFPPQEDDASKTLQAPAPLRPLCPKSLELTRPPSPMAPFSQPAAHRPQHKTSLVPQVAVKYSTESLFSAFSFATGVTGGTEATSFLEEPLRLEKPTDDAGPHGRLGPASVSENLADIQEPTRRRANTFPCDLGPPDLSPPDALHSPPGASPASLSSEPSGTDFTTRGSDAAPGLSRVLDWVDQDDSDSDVSFAASEDILDLDTQWRPLRPDDAVVEDLCERFLEQGFGMELSDLHDRSAAWRAVHSCLHELWEIIQADGLRNGIHNAIHGSGPTRSSTTGSETGDQDGSRKRRRGFGEDGPGHDGAGHGSGEYGDDGDGDDDSGRRPRASESGKRSKKPPVEEKYACPFRKRNPLRFNVRDYTPCALSPFSDIPSMKYAIASGPRPRNDTDLT